jgi:hypothetical protein
MLLAIFNVLVAGSIALFFLDGMDQINLGQFGVILDPHLTSFSPDVFYDHNEPPGFSVNFGMSPVGNDVRIVRIR